MASRPTRADELAVAGLGHRSFQQEHAVQAVHIEQFAGDMLPNATPEQKIATLSIATA
jgi:hypothetical protein